jgi:hypothetical protein
METHQNGKLLKWQLIEIIETATQQNDNSLKQLIKKATHKNGNSSKWQPIKMATHQNSRVRKLYL